MTSGKNIFSAHVQVDNLAKSNLILKYIHKLLRKEFNFYFSTVQLEKEYTDTEEAKDIDITSNTHNQQ